MNSRTFLGVDGLLWRVWHTAPSAPAGVDEHFRGGWLTFESSAARRRLAPVPDGWSTAAIHELQQWCERAARARITIDSVAIALDLPVRPTSLKENPA